jgi:hypothetical protein
MNILAAAIGAALIAASASTASASGAGTIVRCAVHMGIISNLDHISADQVEYYVISDHIFKFQDVITKKWGDNTCLKPKYNTCKTDTDKYTFEYLSPDAKVWSIYSFDRRTGALVYSAIDAGGKNAVGASGQCAPSADPTAAKSPYKF